MAENMEENAMHQQAGPAGPPDGWREMKATELAELCRGQGLAAGGKRADLLKRLELHFHGSSSEHANGRTVCPYCSAPARVNGTHWMSDTVQRRSFRCLGRRRHTFSLDSVVDKAEART